MKTLDKSDSAAVTTVDPGDAQSLGLCAGQTAAHYFCADFDEAHLVAGWTAQDVRAGGAVTLDTSSSRSAPASLLSHVLAANGSAPADAGGASTAQANRALPAAGSAP